MPYRRRSIYNATTNAIQNFLGTPIPYILRISPLQNIPAFPPHKQSVLSTPEPHLYCELPKFNSTSLGLA